MELTSLSQTGVRIKGKEATVIINPAKAADVVGADVVIIDRGYKGDRGDSFIIDNSGEYEVKGVRVYGYKVGVETIYLIKCDEIFLAYLGTVDKELNKDLAEEFDVVNILLTAGNGDPSDLLSQLEPNILVPLSPSPEALARLQKEMGEAAIEKTPKLKVTSFSEEDEETKVVILS